MEPLGPVGRFGALATSSISLARWGLGDEASQEHAVFMAPYSYTLYGIREFPKIRGLLWEF